MWRGTRLSTSQDVVRGRSCADIGCEVGNAFVLEFAVALINHTAIFAVGVPYLCTKVTAAVAADNLT